MDEPRVVNERISLAQLADAGRRNLWPLCVAVLLVSNGLLIWRTRQVGAELSRVYQPINALGLEALMASPFSAAQGCTLKPADIPTRYLVFFITTRYDAPFYTDDAAALNQIARERPDTGVFGLMAYATPDEALEFARQDRIAYRMLADADGRILRGLNLPRTPWTIVIDSAQRRLVYQDPPAASERDRREFVNRVLSLPKQGRRRGPAKD